MKLLNWIAGIVHFKKRKNGVIGIIKGTDGPTAIYYRAKKNSKESIRKSK